ncbi:MAG TPA: hypothetical protein P5274_00300 [Candidatus Paceibacterota bacterium]|nr:hypothetical protein [Candidatus Paceibacterota bacterium]
MSIKEALFQKDRRDTNLRMSTNDTNIKNLFEHHAYLLVGGVDYWREILEAELKRILKIENLSACPDIWWQTYNSFGIKNGHNLIEKEARKSFSGQGRFFVLEISSITPEAENSLLKTLEEPMSDTHFFIIARQADIFLPTVRSRLITFEAPRAVFEVGLQGSPKSDFEKAQKFLKLDLPDRLDFIQKEFLLARAGGKNKDKSLARPLGGKSEIIDFVIDLEKTLHTRIDLQKITKAEELALYELEKVQRYFQNPRSSNRLILEHLALILPN